MAPNWVGGENIKKNVAIVAVAVCIIVVAAAVYLVLRKPEGGTPSGPSFTISVSPSTLTIPHGGSDNLIINFLTTQLPSRLGYSVENLPEGVQYTGTPGSFTPPNPPTTFVLTFTVADNATLGSYPARVVCSDMDENLTSSSNFTLIIT